MSLVKKKCVACEEISKSLSVQEVFLLLKQIPEWKLSADGKNIFREYVKKDFMDAVILINECSRIAEMENHHPDLHLTDYKNLRIELSTHKVNGLTENDFIMAAKINELPRPMFAR